MMIVNSPITHLRSDGARHDLTIRLRRETEVELTGALSAGVRPQIEYRDTVFQWFLATRLPHRKSSTNGAKHLPAASCAVAP